jgi:hypothetical protein
MALSAFFLLIPIFAKYGNDPPERVIGLALASILILKMSYLVFPGFFRGAGFCLALWTYCGAAAASAGSAAGAGSAAAGAAAAGGTAMIAIVTSAIAAAMVAILVFIFVFVLIVVVAEAKP